MEKPRSQAMTLSVINSLRRQMFAQYRSRLKRRRSLAWVEQLREEGSLLGFKACSASAPEGSGMPEDTFFLAIQTPWQQSIHDEVAEYVLCIDGTHNTTQYYNCNLYTVLGRDRWGHGELSDYPALRGPDILLNRCSARLARRVERKRRDPHTLSPTLPKPQFKVAKMVHVR